jgi:hypothetical protein
LLPLAHGHQVKSIATFVAAILEKQTGNQAELARTQGNQEAAVKRLSRLIHNERLNPKDFPEWLCRKALERLPRTGKVRIAIDWTTEDDQHLLVVSLVIGRRAMPIFWRAYEQIGPQGPDETLRVGRPQTCVQVDLSIRQALSDSAYGRSRVSGRRSLRLT